MDISDILEDLNRDPFDDNYDGGKPSGQADLQALTRAWVNERGTTDLLQYAYLYANPILHQLLLYG